MTFTIFLHNNYVYIFVPILNKSVQAFTSYVKSTNFKSRPLFDNKEFNSMLDDY